MTIDTFNVVAGIISIVAFFLAVYEYLKRRSERARDEDRLRMQEDRSRSAIRLAVAGAQTVDLIVQRAKDPDTATAELQSLARSARGTLLFLASEIESHAELLEAWRIGKEFTTSNPPDDDPTASS